jgi:hypothetical protein
MVRPALPLLLLAIVCLSGAPAFAQDSPSTETPAHVSVVDGAAILERDGRSDNEPLSMPLLAGDRLRTQGGRVEVLFADGSALHLDEHTVVDFQSDDVVRLIEGRIRLSIAGAARDVSYRIDAPSAWVQVALPGEYRVSILRNADVELAVLRGAAELVNEEGRSYVRAGERTFARGGASPTPPYIFNSAAWDDFDRWSERRRDHRLGVSAQYLPNDVRPYAAAFDQYGSWSYAQPYGYVWYPRVHVGWRPYYRGRWVGIRPYGWTWITHDPWGWPTHHYGRWGFSAGAWFWIPGRHWGPAWVSWAYARDYVSWSPLGWNNRPVIQIVNVSAGRRWNPWHVWTVVPRGHFGRGHVNVAHVGAVRIDQRVHNTFVVRDRGPDVQFAAGRTAVPIRTAGSFAVPRGVSPGGYATDAGRGTSAQAGERRFPPAARAPRTPSAVQPRAAAESQRSAGGRALQRTDSTLTSPGARASSATRGYEAGASRRAPDVAAPQDAGAQPSSRRAMAAPAGAVRAVPQARERSAPAPASPGFAPSGRTAAVEEQSRGSGPAAPRAVAPRALEQRTLSPSNPGYRAAPQAAPEYRGRAVPRSGSPEPRASYPAAPAYRATPGYRPAPEYRATPEYGVTPDRARPESRATAEYRATPEYRAAPDSRPSPGDRRGGEYRVAPEQRRGPSGPPPSASSPQPRGPGEAAPGGRSRPGSGGGDPPSSGQARRRR